VSGVGSTEPPTRAGAGSAGAGAGTVYEVFRQDRKGQPFQHAGSVEAPNELFADVYAREQFGRRGESTALWIAPRDAISEVGEFVDELQRNYHRVDGYSIKAKLREARERARTAAPRDR
jgi:phenylacetate-CoA oxygenase PaaH subunit